MSDRELDLDELERYTDDCIERGVWSIDKRGDVGSPASIKALIARVRELERRKTKAEDFLAMTNRSCERRGKERDELRARVEELDQALFALSVESGERISELEEEVSGLETSIDWRTRWLTDKTALAEAWKAAFDASELAAEQVWDLIGDMPCDLEDMCPGIDEPLEVSGRAIAKARALEAGETTSCPACKRGIECFSCETGGES